MSERAVAAALDDVMDSIDAYALRPSDENREALRTMLQRWAKVAARHHAGLS